ncbi:dihydroneopterin aldolase [Panacibacter sp. DH6]|uniref:7,8-dihydroneopterin aldolase n=1 Tax=Panacibacter microcysteis TaxID=2793269 RepID=A0A931E3C5_9BACT|nr:dihydroneopterin aldolase [Panacibacter microcysteis]MBG9374811.1 dihydroneopterin aldolase [Panacibacter microcysteis]
MLTIELTGLRFHAFHGLYKEEKKIGGDYEVNVTVQHLPKKIPVQHIDDTIDYSVVYNLVNELMQKPEPLLETVASAIATKILNKFSQAEEVSVSVTKLNPPIIAFQGSVGVKCVLKKQ